MEEIKDIKEIQRISLNILKYIDKICKENDIKYSLCDGTALGAIRHKGFIPWDDDIDIMMTRENYNKFLNLMDNIKDPNYKCLHFGKDFPNYFYNFAKVVDLNTYVEEINFPRHKDMGIFVDVFPVDGIPKDKINKLTNKYCKLRMFHHFAATKKFVKSSKGWMRTIPKFFMWTYCKVFGWKHFYKKSENLLKKYPLKNCDYAGIYCEYGKKEMIPKEMFNETILVDFEDEKFPILKEYNYYLTNVYGDYMTPPPENERQAHHIIAFKKSPKK
ncbi:MAG: LicD family protein [Clostridia bacterium]|nr:LicD family protein [Clostridia bacterium]